MTVSRPHQERTVAIVDLGSNTAKLCVYTLVPGSWFRQVDELRSVVRLAAGQDEHGNIAAPAFERGIVALEQFGSYLRAVGVDEVCATATSAVREAANGEEFLMAAQQRSGLALQVLTGAEEATYGALAVANSFAERDMLVLDIGGGSAQLTCLRDRRVAAAESWRLGAVVSTERFLRHDPPTRAEVAALREQVRRSVKSWLASIGDSKTLPLIGMGGTIRNLANLDIKSGGGTPVEFLHCHVLGKAELARLVKRLLGMSSAERAKLEALSSDRADIIAAGAVVVQEVMKVAGAKQLTVSGNGLREGLLFRYLLPDADPPLLADVRDFSVANLRHRLAQPWPAGRDTEHVAHLALQIYDSLPRDPDHAGAERALLAAAARLHDVGRLLDFRDQHKHGHAAIMGEALPGYSLREQALIALQVRFQRSGKPSAVGLERLLAADDLPRLERLTGLLRVAVALDRTGTGRIQDVRCRMEDGRVTITCLARPGGAADDALATVELAAADAAKKLLEDAYGVKVVVTAAS